MTETQKAALGLPYFANEPALTRARLRARRIFHRFNATLPSPSDPPDLAEGEVPQGIGGSADAEAGEALDVMGSERRAIFAELLGVPKENLSRVEVEPPFWW